MKHILVIDDDTNLSEIVATILREAGYSVVIVTTAQMLYREVMKHTPNLILMDYRLPEEDGAVITRKLRRDKQTAGIPVIMISADHTAERVAKDIGIEGYFAKPFDVEQLILRIDTLTS